jgi:hypothetical protein
MSNSQNLSYIYLLLYVMYRNIHGRTHNGYHSHRSWLPLLSQSPRQSLIWPKTSTVHCLITNYPINRHLGLALRATCFPSVHMLSDSGTLVMRYISFVSQTIARTFSGNTLQKDLSARIYPNTTALCRSQTAATPFGFITVVSRAISTLPLSTLTAFPSFPNQHTSPR